MGQRVGMWLVVYAP